MTSNIGVEVIKNSGNLGFTKNQPKNLADVKSKLMTEVEREFRPEFLNRLDDVVFFKSLDREDIAQIIHKELRGVLNRLKINKLDLEFDDEAINFLVEKGYNAEYGARPLKRAIEKQVDDALSEGILSGKYKGPCKLKGTLNAEKDAITFTVVS